MTEQSTDAGSGTKIREWLILFGLLLDVLGAAIAAIGAFQITPEAAVQIAAPRWGGTAEQMLSFPATQSILQAAAMQRWGFGLVAIGFAFQAVAAQPVWTLLQRWRVALRTPSPKRREV